jgi:uncharacterized membrane-anchored protein YhcB (DUF1043 family)
MVQTIIYIIIGLIVGFILLTMLVGKLLNSSFKNREDPNIIKKWKEKVK